MRIKFIGCGGAFDLDNYNSNILLECELKDFPELEKAMTEHKLGIVAKTSKLLIDCGFTAPFALREQGLKLTDVESIYVSHLHADHVGGLEAVGFATFFTPGVHRPRLYGNGRLLADLWSKTLQGGMGSIQTQIANLETFFDTRPVEANGKFTWGGVDFQTVQTVHVMNGFEIVPSYGLAFKTAAGTRVFLTTDTQFCPHQITDFYRNADLVFQDCETAPYKSGVHAAYTDLKTLEPETKAKMWLYHYQPGFVTNEQAAEDGFAGLVQKGQEFDV